jgi:hypothetical protein
MEGYYWIPIKGKSCMKNMLILEQIIGRELENPVYSRKLSVKFALKSMTRNIIRYRLRRTNEIVQNEGIEAVSHWKC